MVGGETVEQAAMSIVAVAIAITRLLREDFGNLLRVTVSLDHRRVGKLPPSAMIEVRF
jgi:4-hydroxy-3-methylbut-2-en-1-yl diphosphate synthase IspG/GcpE